MDRIFPRDLPVGTVAQIKDGNPFKQIRLKPAAKLESLEDVIVLLSVQPLDLTKSENKNTDDQAMNDTYELRMGEAHIEVHKFHGGAIVMATIIALFLQTAIPVHFPKFA